MIKEIISFCTIISGMIIFIEVVAYTFGPLGLIGLMGILVVIPFVYFATRNLYGLSDEVLNNNTRR